MTSDLGVFLTRAHEFLRSAPALHTTLLSVTDTLRVRGLPVYGDGAPLFGTYAGADGTVRGALVRTPPRRPLLSPLSDLGPEAPEAALALAERLAEVSPDLPGVTAERATAEMFAQAWERHTGTGVSVGLRQRLYRLGTLTPPEPAPPGAPRVATAADRALLARWHEAFGEAVGERTAMAAEEWAEDRIAYGGVTLWEAPDGTPVAMAGVTRRIAGQVRVTPVYAPADLRRRGYGGAVTATVTRAALDAGAGEVLLFTDLANPTSNGLYQRLGYRPVRDFAQIDFAQTDFARR
ncbi:GNAT family N-acetyltransferase [Streptomyces sp. DSM 118878]